MMSRWRICGNRTAETVAGALGVLAFVGCIDRPLKAIPPAEQSGVSETIQNQGIDKVDLLLMMDNSNSMADNQNQIMTNLGPMIQTLTAPPCTSVSNTNAALPGS